MTCQDIECGKKVDDMHKRLDGVGKDDLKKVLCLSKKHITTKGLIVTGVTLLGIAASVLVPTFIHFDNTFGSEKDKREQNTIAITEIQTDINHMKEDLNTLAQDVQTLTKNQITEQKIFEAVQKALNQSNESE